MPSSNRNLRLIETIGMLAEQAYENIAKERNLARELLRSVDNALLDEFKVNVNRIVSGEPTLCHKCTTDDEREEIVTEARHYTKRLEDLIRVRFELEIALGEYDQPYSP